MAMVVMGDTCITAIHTNYVGSLRLSAVVICCCHGMAMVVMGGMCVRSITGIPGYYVGNSD